MITLGQTFRDERYGEIPNCEIATGKKVKVVAAFENDAPLWVQLNKIRLIVVKNVGGSWVYYGVFSWIGAVAVKPDYPYEIATNDVIFPKGEYGVLMDIRFTTAPQESGLSYADGLFNLVFSQ